MWDLKISNAGTSLLLILFFSVTMVFCTFRHELMLHEAPNDLLTEGIFYDHNGISWSLTPLLFIAEKDPKRKILSKELEEEENLLKQCIEKLKVVEANRVALVSQLRDALNEQV